MTQKQILVVAAHPDDEILGCGGTIAKLSATNQVFTIVLGEGVTSRDKHRDRNKRKEELGVLKKSMSDANKLIGVQQLFSFDLPDNRFDSIDLIDITKIIEDVIDKVHPQCVFTHFGNDLNIDHQLTFQAVLTATRPLPTQSVTEVYAFETTSSTEFNFPLSFSPDTFSTITDTLETKLAALACYTSEMREFPHPRSLEMVKQTAQYWGVRVGVPSAEAFKTIRKVW